MQIFYCVLAIGIPIENMRWVSKPIPKKPPPIHPKMLPAKPSISAHLNPIILKIQGKSYINLTWKHSEKTAFTCIYIGLSGIFLRLNGRFIVLIQ